MTVSSGVALLPASNLNDRWRAATLPVQDTPKIRSQARRNKATTEL